MAYSTIAYRCDRSILAPCIDICIRYVPQNPLRFLARLFKVRRLNCNSGVKGIRDDTELNRYLATVHGMHTGCKIVGGEIMARCRKILARWTGDCEQISGDCGKISGDCGKI